VSDEGGVAAIPSSAVVGDPFQPVLLLLPKSRSLDNMPPAGTSGKQKVSPLIGLFGPSMRPEVLQKIKVTRRRWHSPHPTHARSC
jgi:hypothetical protein